MRSFPTDRKIQFHPLLWILLALMVLVLPVRWLLAVFAAALFHELCHCAMIRLCGGRTLSVQIGGSGTTLETEAMTPGKELLCALAGPVGGLLLLTMMRWLPRLVICAAIQSLYNLIPVYPLDGGRALRCFLSFLFPREKAETISLWVERLCLAGILGLGMYGTFFLRLGWMPLIYAGILLYQLSRRKIPCKPVRQRVQ